MYGAICLCCHVCFMRHHDDGESLLIQFLQQFHHLHSGLAVEGTCWLIGKDDLWVGDECSCNGDTLFLTA